MAFKLFVYVIFFFLKTVWSSNFNALQSDNGIACDRSLWEKAPTDKKDIGFRIRVGTNLDLYAPGNRYRVFMEAAMNNSRFTKFVITVDSLNHTDPGIFELVDKVLTDFSRDCPNTIVQTSFVEKTVIEVSWKAPGVDSGCVRIRGALYDTADNLHHSGNLSLKLCQGELDESALPEIIECKACNEASYQLIFEGLWSRQTHPKEFPQNLFETAFEGIIGASHTKNFRLWEIKKNASRGIAEVAENGTTRSLEAELKAQSQNIRTVIKAKSLTHPNLNDKTYANFRTDDNNHLLSLIAKLTPSPDWVVGLSALELCLPNNSWAITRVIKLFPIDVGTIEGDTYKIDGPKIPTIPYAAIRSISLRKFSPFSGENGKIEPLAKVTVNRQRVFGKTKCITNDPTNHEQCAVTDWINNGECNCRTSLQQRRRKYKNEADISNVNCRLSLIDQVPCSCNDHNIYSNTMSCDTTEWGSWTLCTCHHPHPYPYQSRYRHYRNSISSQGCTGTELRETRQCTDLPKCDPSDRNCIVTGWSDWSPCNATCEMTMGKRLRTRLFTFPSADKSNCNVHTVESESCHSDRTNCRSGKPKEICFEPKQEGPCTGYFVRWYYNSYEGRCLQFVYGGCRGNGNSFKSYSECQRVCDNIFKEHPYDVTKLPFPGDPNQVIDCRLSQWAEWSECSNTCGLSWKERRRTVEVNAQNGGQPCENKVFQRKRCKHVPLCEQTF